MPTVFSFKNIKFIIYTRDHNPPHVHAKSPKGEAKINIETLDCFYLRGFSERDLGVIIGFLESKKEILMEKWNEIHN